METATDVLAIIGCLSACWLTFKFTSSLFRGLYSHFLADKLRLSANLTSYGEWAVVTGATDGIGKAYAEQLAEIGLKIVLISRSTTKLEKVAAEIEKTYKVQTKIITADFTEINGIYDDIEAKLEGLEIGILVNNVGMAYAIPGKLLDIPNLKKFIPDIVYCNCASMTMMTQICLPNMIKRKRGVILNISSASAIDPCPYISVYSSTKAYMDLFSRAIDYEYHKNGIIVQSVMPFFVKTNMTNLRKQSFFIPEAWTYVRSALKTIGVESRTHGYFSHSIQAYFARRLPKSYVTNLKISSLSAARERMLKRMKIKEENPK